MKKSLLFLLIILQAGALHYNAQSMEAPTTPTGDTVTVVSKDGQEFELSVAVAKQSGTIKNIIEDAGTDDPIPMPNITGAIFSHIVTFLNALDPLLTANKKAELKDQVYIPRALQPIIDKHVKTKKLSNAQIGQLFTAANYLDIPYVLNGIAAVIADRIYPALPKGLQVDDQMVPWIWLNTTQRLALVANTVAQQGFGRPLKEPSRYILKHVTFRKCDIEQEYSIADYIKEHGQPALDQIRKTISLAEKYLTSLFGIQLCCSKVINSGSRAN